MDNPQPTPSRRNNTIPLHVAVLTKPWTYFHVIKRHYISHSIGDTFPITDTLGGYLNLAGDLIYDGIFVIPSDHFTLRPPTPEEIKIASEL